LAHRLARRTADRRRQRRRPRSDLRRILGEHRAHQLSSLTAIAAFGIYFRALHRRWPIPTTRSAQRIGAAWLGLTVTFEFAFGRLAGKSWRKLVADYNLARGRTWPLVLAWVATGPAVTRRAALRRGR
jgi:hypothetical protein